MLPTFRDYGVTSLFPFKDYDKQALDAFLEKEDAVIFLRTHISEQGNAGPYLSDRVRYLGNEQAEDIMDIADIFDILITDYSSIYIDYLLLDRPLIFLPYDKERYLKGPGNELRIRQGNSRRQAGQPGEIPGSHSRNLPWERPLSEGATGMQPVFQ